MRALFIGGTGTISTAVSNLALENGIELYLLNRGNKPNFVKGDAKILKGDIEDEASIKELIKNLNFDVVADFRAYTKSDLERDVRLFREKTNQFIFISSASVYQKPLNYYKITESTPIYNPYWKYSQNKIECEKYLSEEYLKTGFPFTIIRPSHTYGDFNVPVPIHGANGSWSVVERLRNGKPIIVHGDGTSLWTLTHNTDFAKGFIGIMGNQMALSESIHITSDEVLTWNQIIETIAKVFDVKPNIIHIPTDLLCRFNSEYIGSLKGDKATSVVFDNSKLKRLVPNYVATMRFDQGIKRTIEFILNHTEYQKQDIDFDNWTDNIIELYTKAFKL